MMIVKGNKHKVKEECYELIIETMTGDADDFHKTICTIKNNEEGEKHLKELIVACEILKKSYPSGMGGCDKYVGPYFELIYNNYGWHHGGDGQYQESFEGYELKYHDGLGGIYDCSVIIDQEMRKEIMNNTAERKYN